MDIVSQKSSKGVNPSAGSALNRDVEQKLNISTSTSSQPSSSSAPPGSSTGCGGAGGGGGDRGRGSAAYNASPVESDYPSLTPPAPLVLTPSREVDQKPRSSISVSSQASSSSAPPASQAVQLLGQKPPLRPDFGKDGNECTVRANYLLLEFDPKKDIHRYEVTITPEVASKKISRRILSQLVSSYRESHLGSHWLPYDGRKSVYTGGPLPFNSNEFVIRFSHEDDGRRREREFQVSIKFAANAVEPQETIHALDVVFRESPSFNYVAVGRSFFSPELGTKGEIGQGLEYWKGFYQSVRHKRMGPLLNIDISARPFYEPVLVTEFIRKYLNLRNLTKPLNHEESGKVKRALIGIKVETRHLGYVKSQRVKHISSQPLNQLSFTDDTGKNISVVQYFRERRKIDLKDTFLPAFQSGTDSRPVYLPMEICTIVEGQRYPRKLNERQVNALLKATCQRPETREENIKTMVATNNYNTDKFVHEEFGIKVGDELTSIQARVLPPPMLKYDETGKKPWVEPKDGKWNMMNLKMVDGGKVDYWTCISFSHLDRPDVDEFCKKLVGMCISKGMVFSSEFLPFETCPLDNFNPVEIEDCLFNVHKKFESKGLVGKKLQLLIVILPNFDGSYGTIKRVCETKLGIVTQCCKPRKASNPNVQYLENLSLKINVKVGGRNTVLNEAVQRNIPFLTDVSTIVFGADVTHPPPGDYSSPSIAAVVASMDWPEVTKYRGLVSAQHHRVEIIQDLYKKSEEPQKGVVHGGMIRELLLAFYSSNSAQNRKPQRIIFYRDGVSEGQFDQVLDKEIKAIREACSSLEANYKPRVTFVVVQKRHHTRLFPSNHKDHNLTDRSGNVLPGTVVDTEICHPVEFDFFLCSHAGIQGTSRPTHYHVLLDENEFTADALQTLTYNLCYTYARCTRSVSIVPPAYYAHLTASRARYYMENETSTDLPEIKDNIKDVMFYC